jgi:hypothetical protein
LLPHPHSIKRGAGNARPSGSAPNFVKPRFGI